MKNILKDLKICSLFSHFSEYEIEKTLANISYVVNEFHENQIIAFEADPINSLGIVLNGNIGIQKAFPSGRTVNINTISSGGIFGEVIIFSKQNKYPSTIISNSSSTVLFIPSHEILNLCSTDKMFLNKFMALLSNRILMLNKKIKNLSYGTLREKLASFLLEEYSKQENLKITVKLSRQELADQFGVARPSLSRELIKMREENLITFTRNTVAILSLSSLEECLF